MASPAPLADSARATKSGPLVASFGEVLWDLYPTARHLGGAPANVAFHARAAGAESLLVTRLGRDALGVEASARLARAGLDLRGVELDATHPTGTVDVSFSNGEPRYRIARDVAWDFVDPSPDVRALVARADVFCFGTLAARTAGARARLVRLVRAEKGAPRRGWRAGGGRDVSPVMHATVPTRPLALLDLNLRPPFVEPSVLEACLEHADVVKVNDEELAALGRIFDVPDALDWLLGRGIELVAITHGARGATLVTRRLSIRQPGFPSSGVDPVGAGDAFVARLAVGLARAEPLPAILEDACRRAAWVAARTGGMPT